jgi:hypothetical protein
MTNITFGGYDPYGHLKTETDWDRKFPHHARYLRIEAWLRRRYTWFTSYGEQRLTIWERGYASKYTRLEVAFAHRYGIL